MYLTWLIPFQLFWVGLEWDEFITWLRDGTILEMIFSYPIGKTAIRLGPWVKKTCGL